jgi:phosphomevalonate kinase
MNVVHNKTLQALETEDEAELKTLFKENLRLKDKLTKLSGAEVVPESVKKTLTTILDLDGSILAGIPGAGGYDAIYTLTRRSGQREAMEKLSTALPQMVLLEEDVV